MENAANWRTESRTVYSNDFKLRMVELASRPDANVAQLAREHGVDNNLIFKWLRLWQREGRISRRMPATIVGPVVPQPLPVSPTLLSVDVINDTQPIAENDTLCTFSSTHSSATSCHVEFRHGKMTLENPSSELLAVLIRELTGRTQ
ncbi:TPA: transposase [Klebsiella pneumoniae]